MLSENYQLNISNDFTTYEFESIGPKGSITKVVKYSEINVKGYYNLGFGDKDPLTGYICDLSVSNNNDSKKVLRTVAATLYTFFSKNTDAIVIATGSTEARTRLYRIGITNNIELIEQDFIILGLKDTHWEEFKKNETYGAFLVMKKL